MPWRRFLANLVVPTEPEGGRILAMCALLAFLAGGAKAVLRRNERTAWKDVLASAIASGVAGTIVGSLCIYAWGTQALYLILPCVGIAGWVGVSLLDWAGAWAMGRVRARINGERDER
jgi:peptidoglycan/LPS O-acetylase OafA/YrhL